MPDLEPWLRGPIPGVDPLLMPVLHALLQAQEDVHRHTRGLRNAQVWARPHGLTPLGFHLRHIAGSLDRLTTYLEDRALTDDQFAFLRAELQAGSKLADLVDGVDKAIERTSQIIRNLV